MVQHQALDQACVLVQLVPHVHDLNLGSRREHKIVGIYALPGVSLLQQLLEQYTTCTRDREILIDKDAWTCIIACS